MIDNLIKLLDEFYLIQCRGWVKNTGVGSSSAGSTFEHLLGKQTDTSPLPDYLGIELKTKLIVSKYRIGLFSSCPDNRPNTMQILWNKCSWRCNRNKCTRELYDVISATEFSNHHRKYSFKLHVNYDTEKIELLLYNNWNKKIELINISWSFSTLQYRLERKLNYLALIHAEKFLDIKTKQLYFKYSDITLYKLKDFSTFLALIEQGKIFAELRMYAVINNEGEEVLRNREFSFCISESDLALLFNKIDVKELLQNKKISLI